MAALFGELSCKNERLLEVDAENGRLLEICEDRHGLQQELDSVQTAMKETENKASVAIDNLQQVTNILRYKI